MELRDRVTVQLGSMTLTILEQAQAIEILQAELTNLRESSGKSSNKATIVG